MTPSAKKIGYAGQEMSWLAAWRDDPQNAPYGEWVLTFGQGGITIKMLDENGNWHGRSGLSEQNPGELGRPRMMPSHWMLLPDPPFAPLGNGAPSVASTKEKRKRNGEGLAGAI